MPSFEIDVDYQEVEFPRNWPNEDRIKFINSTLANATNKSVELFRRGDKLIVRIWFVDHLNAED